MYNDFKYSFFRSKLITFTRSVISNSREIKFSCFLASKIITNKAILAFYTPITIEKHLKNGFMWSKFIHI